jgi:murein L,D-transpeptidase YafK
LFLIIAICCVHQKPSAFATTPNTISAPIKKHRTLSFLIDSLKLKKYPVKIVISKTNYTLTVLVNTIQLKQLPCVFGTNPKLADKRYEGDRCTPEGIFHVTGKYPSKDWVKFILLDYPTADSWKKHNASKKKNEIPANATIGSFVGIHSADEKYDGEIDNKNNWTWGCIALKNHDLLELYDVVSNTTIVEILK